MPKLELVADGDEGSKDGARVPKPQERKVAVGVPGMESLVGIRQIFSQELEQVGRVYLYGR